MALTNNTLPSNLPTRAVPLDVGLQFCSSAQVLTATGYFNNIVGAGNNIDLQPGRHDLYWVCDLATLDLTSGDETYRLLLLGSNDAAFGNSNVEVLAALDFAAATAGRLLPTICPASLTVPPANATTDRYIVPFSTHRGRFVFRYMRCYLIAAGTTPSISMNSWMTADLD